MWGMEVHVEVVDQWRIVNQAFLHESENQCTFIHNEPTSTVMYSVVVHWYHQSGRPRQQDGLEGNPKGEVCIHS